MPKDPKAKNAKSTQQRLIGLIHNPAQLITKYTPLSEIYPGDGALRAFLHGPVRDEFGVNLDVENAEETIGGLVARIDIATGK